MRPLGFVLALSAAFPAAAQAVTVIHAGRVITMAGADLEDVTIVIDNGRIKAVGKDLEAPWNATVVDARDKVVMPTWILAHTSGGMRGGNENLANVPYLTVQDAVDPSSNFFEEGLRNGIGTFHVIPGNQTLIGGAGLVCKPVGVTVEDLIVRGRGALKLSLLAERGGRVTKIRQLRRALDEVRSYAATFAREQRERAEEKAAGGTPDPKASDEMDPTKKPAVDLLQGTLTGHLFVPDAASLPEALRIVSEYGFDAVLVLGPQTHKAAALLRGLKHPVVLAGDVELWEKDEDTGKEELVCPGAVLAKLGIAFALSVGTATSGAERYPWWQMATLMRHGVDRDTALRALTTVPAEILGIGDELGRIVEGQRATLQILTGDPLQATTWVDQVWLDGELAYERSKDARLKHLFGRSEAGR